MSDKIRDVRGNQNGTGRSQNAWQTPNLVSSSASETRRRIQIMARAYQSYKTLRIIVIETSIENWGAVGNLIPTPSKPQRILHSLEWQATALCDFPLQDITKFVVYALITRDSDDGVLISATAAPSYSPLRIVPLALLR